MTNSRLPSGRPRRRRPLAISLVLAALLAVPTACTPAPPALEWETVAAPDDCRCADGSPFSFWERRADETRVVLFLNGGGVCWDARSCAFTSTDTPGESEFYDWNLSGTNPENRNGMFDTTRSDNPFAEYSFLYVSSCTGDAHLGSVSQAYSPELTVEHNGYVNGTAALDYLAEQYPDATEVVVVGKTAGSVAAPLYGGLVADLLPDAKVTVFGGQSGAWPDNPDFNTDVLDTAWGAYGAMPDWAVAGLAVRDWGVPGFWTQAGLHHPDLVLARFDYAYDPHAAVEITDWERGDSPSLEPVPGFDELAVIDANEAAIEAAGVPLHSYTAPGDDHGLHEFDAFYDTEVGGVRLTDWLAALVGDDPPDDVRCEQCAP
ncbi:pectin acetylesterase-family hydrolase [Beutenbergia cavernae]|nr:pectin acetylesterase-family hydrolase [Beutenbergia cavernae]